MILIFIFLFISSGVSAQDCSGTVDVSSRRSFGSPVDSTGSYSPNLSCGYVIRVPAGQVIQIDFHDIAIENAADCEYDSITMYDGSHETSPLIGRICGSRSVSIRRYSRKHIMLVMFKSDHSTQLSGFTATFTAVNAQTALDYSCGLPAVAPRIVGGAPATRQSFPWQVALVQKGLWEPLCGGTVIRPRVIITAAHCLVYETAARMDVLIGLHDYIDDNTDGLDVQRLGVAKMVLHENYDSISNAHDIAVIITDLDIAYTATVRPACLPELPPIHDELCFTSGWGLLQSDGDYPYELHKVQIPLIGRTECEQLLGSQIDDTMICAGDVENGGIDSCQGDSGGPLVCLQGSTSRWSVVGATSFGEGCAVPRLPGVYSDVYHHLESGWFDPYLVDGYDPLDEELDPCDISAAKARGRAVRMLVSKDGSYYYLDTMEQIHGDTFYYTDSDFTQINGFPISNTAIVIVVNDQKWEVDGGIDLQSGTLVVHQSLSNDVNQNIVTPSDSIAAINGDDFTDDSDDDVYSLEYESVLTKYSGDLEDLPWVLSEECDPSSCNYKDPRKTGTNVNLVFRKGGSKLALFSSTLVHVKGESYLTEGKVSYPSTVILEMEAGLLLVNREPTIVKGQAAITSTGITFTVGDIQSSDGVEITEFDELTLFTATQLVTSGKTVESNTYLLSNGALIFQDSANFAWSDEKDCNSFPIWLIILIVVLVIILIIIIIAVCICICKASTSSKVASEPYPTHQPHPTHQPQAAATVPMTSQYPPGYGQQVAPPLQQGQFTYSQQGQYLAPTQSSPYPHTQDITAPPLVVEPPIPAVPHENTLYAERY